MQSEIRKKEKKLPGKHKPIARNTMLLQFIEELKSQGN